MEIQNINSQLSCVQEAILWTEQHLQGDKKDSVYNKLVNIRRQLKKIRFALTDNPAAAIYGESQKGKSYLVSSLLTVQNSPFYVIDSNGNKYDFKLDINPQGEDKESTSVVTRFSSNYNWINENFPVKVQLLSILDVILILSDTYYNDLNNHNVNSISNINNDIKQIQENVKLSSTNQSYIGEDDILEIKEYFEKYFKSKTSIVIGSDYFDVVSKNISKIPIHNWFNTFSLLWNNNPLITELFKKLLFKLEEIDFVKELYIPYKAVLRKHGTILDVRRLIEINSQEKGKEEYFEEDTQVFYIKNSNEEVTKTFKKSFLCALTAELVFKLPDEVRDNKPFLSSSDLLDFPGAKVRLEINESSVNEKSTSEMLLRGKVAYLFNRYEDNHKINSLLFCHDKVQASPRFMPTLLNNWVTSTIGENPENREEFLEDTKISPLFIIATKFNLDLKIIQSDNPNSKDSLNLRWEQRFNEILKKELIDVNRHDWFVNWSFKKKYFDNIYLLRDYYFSSEEQSQLYKGFNEHGKEIEEIFPTNYPDFRKDLKASFMQHPFVQKHFSDPGYSWDEATKMNKDGTELIIKNLTIATKNLNKARENRFHKKLDHLKENLQSELKKHFHSGDSDDLLLKAKEAAGRLQIKLDISYGKNAYFFSELISAFMISEAQVYNHFRDVMSDLESKIEIKFNEYTNIRMNVPEISSENDFAKNLEMLTKAYDLKNAESCKAYFEEQKIDLNELFYGNRNKMKMYSTKLAESLKVFWIEECEKTDFKVIGGSIDKTDLNEVLNMFELLYEKVNITEKIAKNLEVYVDRYNQVDLVQEMIADIAAETINKFVASVGFEHFQKEVIEEFKEANEKNDLGLNFEYVVTNREVITKSRVGELFESIDNLPKMMDENATVEKLNMIPSYMNYKKWSDLLKFGFIAVCDIPNYDVKANEQLGEIIKNCYPN